MLARAGHAARRAAARLATASPSRSITYSAPFGGVEVPDVSLTSYILENAASYGDRPALVDGTGKAKTIVYSQLATRIGSAASKLVDKGFGPGKTLGIHLPNTPEYIVAFNAAGMAGGRVTTLSPMATKEELAYQLRDADASIVLTSEAHLATMKEAAEQAGCVKEVVNLDSPQGDMFKDDDGVDGASLGQDIDPDQCFALPYSSGTTGLPKGVMLSHRNLVANIQQVTSVPEHDLDMSASDVVLGVLPAYHIYAMTVVCKAALRVGATVVMLPRFDPAEFLSTIHRHRVSWAPLVPPLVHFLARHPVVDPAKLDSLRVIFSGAAPLSADMQSAVEARLPGVSVRQGYGMTELSPVSHFARAASPRAGSIGFLAPGCEAKLLDVDSGEELGEGAGPGELCIRGPNVMLGYLKNDAATAETMLPDGFLRTGDVAEVLDDGQWAITDRIKELIKVKGFQVAPAELEGVLMQIPGVADAAVISVSHDRDGERPKAFVVRAPSEAGEALTAAAVRDAVAKVVAHYKQVHEVEFIDAVPRSASGKILRRMLRSEA